MPRLCWFLLVSLLTLSTAGHAQDTAISMGNGASNWIITDDAVRSGATLSFPEVQIDGAGWLVLHPFENGRPNGNVVAGYAALDGGTSRNVEVTLDAEPATGDMFIVMLHSDANGNGEFDFVFVNEREVVDKAVFEGNTMIGHAYAVP